jgi:hypothetical protein
MVHVTHWWVKLLHNFIHCYIRYTGVACAEGPSYHVLNWLFLPKPGFLGYIWIFSEKNRLQINISHILNPNLTKWIPLNPAHQDLSNNTKGTFQFLWNVQRWFNLIFTEKIFNIQKLLDRMSKRHETKPMHPSSSRTFQRPRTRSEASRFSGSIKYKQNKQTNYLPSYIDMLFAKIWH